MPPQIASLAGISYRTSTSRISGSLYYHRYLSLAFSLREVAPELHALYDESLISFILLTCLSAIYRKSVKPWTLTSRPLAWMSP